MIYKFGMYFIYIYGCIYMYLDAAIEYLHQKVFSGNAVLRSNTG